MVGEEWEGRTGCGRENVFNPTIVSDYIFSLTCTKNLWQPGSARTRWGELEQEGVEAEIIESVTSKSIIARDFVFQSKCMLAAGPQPDLLRELRHFPYLIFVPQNHQKGLAIGLRPDPLVELERSPRPLAAEHDMEGNTTL